MEDEDRNADPLFDVKIEMNDDSSHKVEYVSTDLRTSFKIVQTIENGKLCLWTVPKAWESDGLLRWPRLVEKVEKLRRNPHSKPLDSWQITNCILKKSDLESFDFAETVIRLMTDTSDYEDIETEEPINGDKIQTLTSDGLAQSSIQNQRLLQDIPREATDATSESEPEMEDFANILVIPAERCRSSSFQPKKIVLKAAVTSDKNGTSHYSEINTKLDSLCTFVSSIAQDQQVLLRNQEIILNKLSEISQKFDSSLTNDTEIEPSVLFRHANHNEILPTGPLKPISDQKSLDELEQSLKDKHRAADLKKKYSVICGYGKGRAITNAYVLLDVMFERRFLLQCSWAGGSRSADSKVCFKSYVNVIDFFFQVIHSSDKRFTMIECHAFFQKILKNAKKRCEAKRMRASSVRHRRKRLGNMMKPVMENNEDNRDCPGSENGDCQGSENESLHLKSNDLHFLL